MLWAIGIFGAGLSLPDTRARPYVAVGTGLAILGAILSGTSAERRQADAVDAFNAGLAAGGGGARPCPAAAPAPARLEVEAGLRGATPPSP